MLWFNISVVLFCRSEESGYDKSSTEESPYTVVVEKGSDGNTFDDY